MGRTPPAAETPGQLDLCIAQFIGENGAAGAAAISGAVGVDPRRVALLLASLGRRGLVEEHRLLADRPALYALSAGGWRACGFAPPRARRPAPGNFEHLTAVADTAAAMTGLGWLVLGERRYRLIERTTGDLIGSVPLGERLHRPDLLLIGGSRVIAVEVELTVKAPRRLERICRGFARARHLDGVVYFAAPRPARAVQRAVAAAGAGGAVRVYALAETDELRPPEP